MTPRWRLLGVLPSLLACSASGATGDVPATSDTPAVTDAPAKDASDLDAPAVDAPTAPDAVTEMDASVGDVTPADVVTVDASADMVAPDVVTPDAVAPDVVTPDVVVPDVVTPDVPSATCSAGCTTGCPQGCFDLGPCVATGAALDLTPNVRTVGVVIPAGPTGDTGTLFYRPAGGRAWSQAQPLVRLPDGRFAGSVFNLSPNSRYELRAAVGAAVSCAIAGTEPLVAANVSSATLHVQAGAGPGGDGSAARPFATIQAGVDAARAGTDVVVHPGVYREAVTVSGRGGREGAYLRVMAMTGAVLDGADATAQSSGLTWRSDGGSVYSAPWTGDPRYLSREGQRMYHYTSLAGLRAGLGDDDVPIAEGFFVEGGRLYLRSATSPTGRRFEIPRFNAGVALDGATRVWIQGLEVRNYGDGEYGKGIDVRACDHVVVRHNDVYAVPSPVWVRRGSAHVRVEENTLHQTVSPDWTWDALKGTDHENSAITLEGGRQAIVTANVIYAIFNGIYAGSFSNDNDATIAYDVDVYENRIADTGDDGLEPEGACVNNRFWGNAIDRTLNGISLAPITWGPTWVLRNRVTSFRQSGFKVSNGSRGRVWIYHNTTYTDVADTNGMGVSGPFQNMVFRNNVVRGTRYAFEMTITAMPNDLDYDGWFTPRGAPVVKWSNVRYDTLAAWCGSTGLECHGVGDDPALDAPTLFRFAPRATSPVVDRGARLFNVNDAFRGAGPDLGYVEAGEAEPAPAR